MVPDKFNMVDMEGIDILFSYEDIIPGLYQKLVESITQCRYQCLYNWYFDGVLIPPTYVEMTVIDNKVWIGNGVSVDEEDTLEFLAPGLKSVTGEVAHITDALARKVYQLVCYINPNQDLHGYNHPWIGGAGKNLLVQNLQIIKAANPSGTWSNNVYSYSGLTFTVNADDDGNIESVDISGTVNSSDVFFYFFRVTQGITINAGSYICSGYGSGYKMRIGKGTSDTLVGNVAPNGRFTLDEDSICSVSCRFQNMSGTAINETVYPMIRLSSVSDATFEPYSNICPITGYTGLNVYRESSYDTEADPTIMVNWQDEAGTVWGGSSDVLIGRLTVTDAEIASYDGETLPSTWISSMDVYAEGVTPTTGAQVVYKLAEPLIYDLTRPQAPVLLQGENYIWHDANGDTSVTYWYNKF